jgi:HSP20 family protein
MLLAVSWSLTRRKETIMLMRTDPFRDVDRLAQQLWGWNDRSRPASMPIDAFRHGDSFLVQFDIPGVDPDSIELTVEQNVLTVRADRNRSMSEGDEVIVSERPSGTFTRQLFLGETLDTENIEARYEAGVLTLTLRVAEQAKPRRVAVTSADAAQKAIDV